ncbi:MULTISPECIES: formyltetrahydrofolate deformylase [unclassified Nocardioides]|uniref:formyltetrahydrofolate deformylase n=1 Tax=unclassified Nocardioides TaxID=2615069 RepID=UPI0009F02768|nr:MULTISPECIES: formyltetrahydrofolate deformylase [unclassified Nocardioides]GAW52368.1 Formyltetrahydrofolate deformylase (Formyl-FH(4) hydrolase) [Nocardioides sp. PD653-B2]GAW57026.1 Formyltetrahydrofolate deformylase (Formyl-FH(4) hydrolase) [Nocardioides sp. PD653]
MTRPADAQHGVLVLSCLDAPGIVHAVSGVLVQEGCTIVESHQFDSLTSGMFYMRVEFAHSDGSPLDFDRLRRAMDEPAKSFQMRWQMTDAAERQRVLIMVSQYAHCLNDLLFRNSIGELNLDVVAIVSNHPTLEGIATFYGVPFHHIPVTRETKPEAEAALLDIVRRERVDLVVLARYMQILSNELCDALEGRTINIHHSMLPSFKGARPYHQAHDRGVKFIGATAHYVTGDLDEGPIIEQEMLRVDHHLSPEQLAARGREAETRALSHAVRWHTENRIIIQGNRTVVFE